jgi:hypothetical protein
VEVVSRSFRVERDRSELETFAQRRQQLIETLDGRDLVAVLDPADRGLPGTGTDRELTLREPVGLPALSQQGPCIHPSPSGRDAHSVSDIDTDSAGGYAGNGVPRLRGDPIAVIHSSEPTGSSNTLLVPDAAPSHPETERSVWKT